MLKKIASRLSRDYLRIYVRSWKHFILRTERVLRALSTMTNLISTHSKAQQHLAFRSWKAHDNMYKTRESNVRGILNRLVGKRTAIGFGTWKTNVTSEIEKKRRIRDTMRATILKIIRRRLSLAFRIWSSIISKDKQTTALKHHSVLTLRRAILNFARRLVVWSFGTWKEGVKQILEREEAKNRAQTLCRRVLLRLGARVLRLGEQFKNIVIMSFILIPLLQPPV